MGDDFKLEDIMIILQRRLLYFLVPTVLLMPVGIVAIMLLPAQYTAEGTILVESQQIPEQLLQTSGNSYAQERIQVIRQRVMTRDRLLGVADKFDLFPRSLNYSESEKVSKMRERLRLRLISADPGRRRSRQDGTIAFSVSYSDRAKDKAYLVANEFLTLFQTEDAKTRTRGASETTEFFEQETRRLRATVDALDGRVSTYKEQNSDALPEHLSLHIQQSERAAQDLNDTNSQISLAQEELRSLEMQLASYLTSGAAVDGPAQELSRLKAELASLKADKTDQHPDVRAVASQIRSIESQLQPSRTIQALRRELDAKQETLRAARTSDETSTEDLEALSIAVSEARQALSNQLTQEAAGAGNDFFAASLRGRMEIAINRLTALNEKATLLREQMNTLEDRIARTPAVERGLATLIRDRQNAYSQYETNSRQATTGGDRRKPGRKSEG